MSRNAGLALRHKPATDLDMCKAEFIEMNTWSSEEDKWIMPKDTLAPTLERRAQEFLCIPCRSHISADMIEDHVKHPRHVGKAKWRKEELEKLNAPAITVSIPPPPGGKRIPMPPLASKKEWQSEMVPNMMVPRFPKPPDRPHRSRSSRRSRKSGEYYHDVNIFFHGPQNLTSTLNITGAPLEVPS